MEKDSMKKTKKVLVQPKAIDKSVIEKDDSLLYSFLKDTAVELEGFLMADIEGLCTEERDKYITYNRFCIKIVNQYFEILELRRIVKK